jgi:urate oxidase
VAIELTGNQYGKAETRVVRLTRDGDRHALTDLSVTTSLAGDLAATHLTGDNSQVLPTDTQKNTVYAFAAEHGIGQIEQFGLRLARHFVTSQPAISRARVSIEQYGWTRLGPHSFQRDGGEVRTATVTVDGDGEWVVSGLTGLVLLNTTGSEFVGFAKDRYTTLPEATDRILATAVDARWRHASAARVDWAASFTGVRGALVDAFVATYSRSLQQTLYAMGRRALEARPEIVEVRLSLPNKHHLPVDLSRFGEAGEPNQRHGGLPSANEVFVATDRPYGLIEGTIARDDAPPAGSAW